MSTLPTVVCAVDLSPRSAKVIQHAGAIAEHFRARLIVTTVGTSEVLATSALEALIRDVLPGTRNWTPNYDVRVVAGTPSASILRVAHEERADLLVIGTHGAGGSREHALGSTMQAVLRRADLPVLMVPNSVTDLHSLDDRRELSDLTGVLAPVDFGAHTRRDARIAVGIAETLGVPLLLLHVSPAESPGRGLDPDSARAHLSQLREELASETPIETLAITGDPAKAIAAVASVRNFGLVVMGLPDAGGTEVARPSSTAYRMLCTTSTMLLALPPVLRRPAHDAGMRSATATR